MSPELQSQRLCWKPVLVRDPEQTETGRSRNRWQDPDFQASTGSQEVSESDWDQKHDQVVTHRSSQDQVKTGRLSGRG